MSETKTVDDNLFSVRGRVIAIIGATGLLGTEYVAMFAARGASVVIGDVDQSKCDALAQQVAAAGNDHCIPVVVDVTDTVSLQHFFEKILARYKRLDVLVNNAQIKPPGFYATFEKYSKDTLTKVLDGNLVGVVLSCQHACKQFLRQGGGVIINVASTYGLVGADQRIYKGVTNIYFPGEPFGSPVSYAISKAGIVNLTRYLASYYREKNIRVNCLTPGGVYDNHDRRFVEEYVARTLLGRMAQRNEYNAAMLFLASDASSYMTGANLVVDGGWTAQ